MDHGSIACYVWYTVLPVGTACLVSREPGKLLLTVSIIARNLEVVQWVITHLAEHEQNALRAAFGCGPVGTPLPDELMHGRVRRRAPQSIQLGRSTGLQAELGA